MKVLNKHLKILFLALIFTLSISTAAYADTWGGTRPTYNGNLHFWEDSSVSANGYSAIFSYARSYWANNGSKLYGFYGYTNNDYTCDEYYVTNSDIVGRFGYTATMMKDSNGNYYDGSANGNWLFCRVFLYKNQIDSLNLTYEEKIGTAAHEIGHSMKLAHNTQSSSSIMNPSDISLTTTQCYYNQIYTYDNNELKSKWGTR